MMKNVVLALALLAASASATLYTNDHASLKYMWEQFKQEHQRVFAAEEEHGRFQNFVAFLKLVDERNAKDTATHGITKFADLSPEEFKKHFTNYVPGTEKNATSVEDEIEPLPEGVDALVDWTGKFTTPVKDQGYCGSCWAFSATEQVESDYIRSTGDVKILSAQQTTTCTYRNIIVGGCNGGNTGPAYDYMQGGVELESDYPYTSGKAGDTGTCESDSSKFVVKTTGYTTVSSSAASESKMATYMQGTGPLSICVDANSWSSYTGGVMSTCGQSVDHCVQAVGVDTSAGYWKVRNSWGTSWGESGYIRLAYGKNTCALASDATYAAVAAY